MIPKVSDILAQKFSEIQSRIPVRINGFGSQPAFQEYLDVPTAADALSTEEADGSGSTDKSANIARAKAALEASTAYVPTDKSERMSLINSNLEAAAKKYGIDINLLKAVTKLESGFDPYAISSSGAQGLMQLMPGTADALGVKDPFSIEENIDGGARYLRDQLVNFGGSTELALAAYNAGPNSVKKYNGIPPYNETQNYVRIVMDYYRQYSASSR